MYTWACLIFSSSYSFLSTPIFSSSSSLPTTIASVKFTYHVHGLFDRCRGFDWHWLMFAIIRFEPAAAKRIRKNNFFASIVHCRSGHRVSIVKSHNNVRSSVFCLARWIVFIFLKAVSRVVLYVFLLFSFIPSYKNIFFKALGDLVGQFFNKTIWEQLKKRNWLPWKGDEGLSTRSLKKKNVKNVQSSQILKINSLHKSERQQHNKMEKRFKGNFSVCFFPPQKTPDCADRNRIIITANRYRCQNNLSAWVISSVRGGNHFLLLV